MIETMLESTFSGSITSWADSLAEEIRSGAYSSSASGWIDCIGATKSVLNGLEDNDQVVLGGRMTEFVKTTATHKTTHRKTKTTTNPHPTSSPMPNLDCPLQWARESNAYDCVRSIYLHPVLSTH